MKQSPISYTSTLLNCALAAAAGMLQFIVAIAVQPSIVRQIATVARVICHSSVLTVTCTA
jgi:hypothetical protein